MLGRGRLPPLQRDSRRREGTAETVLVHRHYQVLARK